MNNRPIRQPLFQHPNWPPAPTRGPPTPAIVRAARAAAAANNALPTGGGAPLDLNTSLTRAQQVQAHALAAQAAHQLRVLRDVALDSDDDPEPHQYYRHRSSLGAPPPDFKFGVGFTGFTNPVPYPSLNGSVSSQDLVDELQVDMSLPLITDPAATLDGSNRPFTSPSQNVDISAWLPPPGPPLLVADDSSIAASAVPFADWCSEFIWLLSGRSVTSSPSDIAGSIAPALKWLNDPDVLRHSTPNTPDFAVFKAFVKDSLTATITSPQGLFLALLYVSKLPIGNLFAPSASSPRMRGLVEWSPKEFAFRSELYGLANVYGHVSKGVAAKLILSLGLMLSNKWLEDNTFTTKTWHDVTGIPQSQLKGIETVALGIFGFSLSVDDQEWLAWLLAVRKYTSSLGSHPTVGNTGGVGVIGDRLKHTSGGANYAVINKVDELIRDTRELIEEKSRASAMSPGRTLGLDEMIMGGVAEVVVDRSEDNTMEEDQDEVAMYPNAALSRVKGGHGHSRTVSLPSFGSGPVRGNQWGPDGVSKEIYMDDSSVHSSSQYSHHASNSIGGSIQQSQPQQAPTQQHHRPQAAYYDQSEEDEEEYYYSPESGELEAEYEYRYERPTYILHDQHHLQQQQQQTAAPLAGRRHPGRSQYAPDFSRNNPFENDMVPHPGVLMMARRQQQEEEERMMALRETEKERERREKMYGAGEEHLRVWPHPPMLSGRQLQGHGQQVHGQTGMGIGYGSSEAQGQVYGHGQMQTQIYGQHTLGRVRI